MKRGGVSNIGKEVMGRLPLIADLILFGTLCASFAYWGMPFVTPQPRPVVPKAQPMEPGIPRTDAAAGMFGGQPADAAFARSFQLTGVIADGPEGVANLSTNGKPPQVLGVGMEAEPGVTLTEVNPTYVLLNEGGLIKRVDLPENAKGKLEIGVLAQAGQSVALRPGRSGGPIPARKSGEAMPDPVMNVNNGEVPIQQQ